MKNLRMIVDGGSFDVTEAIRELAAAVLALAPPAEKSDDEPAKAPAPAAAAAKRPVKK